MVVEIGKSINSEDFKIMWIERREMVSDEEGKPRCWVDFELVRTMGKPDWRVQDKK